MLSTGCDHSLHIIHMKYPYEKQPFPGTSSGKEAAVKGMIPKLLNPFIMNLLCVKCIRWKGLQNCLPASQVWPNSCTRAWQCAFLLRTSTFKDNRTVQPLHEATLSFLCHQQRLSACFRAAHKVDTAVSSITSIAKVGLCENYYL